ncbi:MAG: hypothetical protein ACR2OO_04015 [Thermomicrobiales bacterium]
MAAVAKSGTPSLSTRVPGPEHSIIGLVAGEDIAACDACYIAAGGTVFRSTGAAATPPADVVGFAPVAASSGEAVSLYFGVNFRYGTALTPGTKLYLSGAVAGGLDTVASVGGTSWVGRVIDATRVHVRASTY